MTSTFGSTHFRPSAFGSQCGGSRVAGYSKTVEVVDVGNMGSTGPQQLESISAMPVYKDKSTEELRWEDYKSGDKGFAAPSGECQFGQSFATPFSSTSAICKSLLLFNLYQFICCFPNTILRFDSLWSIDYYSVSFVSFCSTIPPSPLGLSVNPFSSTPSNTFPPKTLSSGSSGFGESTACPFTTAPSTLWGFGTASGFGSGANGSAPSFIESSSPTFGSSPSVCSSSFTFGTSSQPVSGSHSYPLFGTLNSSVSSPFGSVAPNSVSPSSSGPITAQSLFHAKCHPSFQKTHPFSGQSNIPLTPSFIPSFGALNISSTASTGNGSEGNLCSSPTSAAGFDPTNGMALVGMPSVQQQVLQIVDFEDIGRAQH
ncbi:hypothetical protein RHGRI_032061 [Rhododendron griersonianum]|uniref:Uncharacterized protein n=1 Tax=Rhododendron griersonianum TaxID=479676 RepID=A0AAV6ICS2_9ERIC|nr:hypothetical protein RHGRI_032061 [Rhododendron griersonianum]